MCCPLRSCSGTVRSLRAGPTQPPISMCEWHALDPRMYSQTSVLKQSLSRYLTKGQEVTGHSCCFVIRESLVWDYLQVSAEWRVQKVKEEWKVRLRRCRQSFRWTCLWCRVSLRCFSVDFCCNLTCETATVFANEMPSFSIDILPLRMTAAIQWVTRQLLTLDLDHNTCMTSKAVKEQIDWGLIKWAFPQLLGQVKIGGMESPD